MLDKIILASKSKVRKEILVQIQSPCEVKPSTLTKIVVKESLSKIKLHQKLYLKI